MNDAMTTHMFGDTPRDRPLPCPFCGSTSVKVLAGVSGYADSVVCGCGCDYDGSVEEWNQRAALSTHAAAPAQEVKVKALVWNEDDVAEVGKLGLRYLLVDPEFGGDDCNGWYVLEEATNTVIEADGSPEAARAGAQADYTARILSALDLT